MAPGTIIRILIGIILLIVPGILAIIFGARYLIYYIFLALIPFLFVWEEGCNCTNCLFTGYCEYTKKVRFVKNIFKFLGYDKDKIDNIQIQKYKTDNNSYKEIFKYIKNNV